MRTEDLISLTPCGRSMIDAGSASELSMTCSVGAEEPGWVRAAIEVDSRTALFDFSRLERFLNNPLKTPFFRFSLDSGSSVLDPADISEWNELIDSLWLCAVPLPGDVCSLSETGCSLRALVLCSLPCGVSEYTRLCLTGVTLLSATFPCINARLLSLERLFVSIDFAAVSPCVDPLSVPTSCVAISSSPLRYSSSESNVSYVISVGEENVTALLVVRLPLRRLNLLVNLVVFAGGS